MTTVPLTWNGSTFTRPSVKGDSGGASSLDNRRQNCTHAYQPCDCQRISKRRRGRFFQRAMTGLKLGGDLRLVTLTTSEEAWETGLDIRSSFRKLVMRLRRRRLLSGYIKVMEFSQRGRPHYHVIVRGTYIAQWWLSQIWQTIHLSPVVDIRRIKVKHRAALYLAKYLGKDRQARYSWSWDWVWRGFAKDWHDLLVFGMSRGFKMPYLIDTWECILASRGVGWSRDGPRRIGVYYKWLYKLTQQAP